MQCIDWIRNSAFEKRDDRMLEYRGCVMIGVHRGHYGALMGGGMAEDHKHEAQIKRNPVIRALLLVAGVILLAIGIAGYIVPGLPGTVFVLISAACFFRSSQRFYDFVTKNKWFGRSIREYREGKGMPLKAKIISLSLMWGFACFAMFASYVNSQLPGIPREIQMGSVDASIAARLGTVVLLVWGTVFILRVPTKRS